MNRVVNVISFGELCRLLDLISDIDKFNNLRYKCGDNVFAFVDRYEPVINKLGVGYLGEEGWDFVLQYLYGEKGGSEAIINRKQLYDKIIKSYGNTGTTI